MNAHRNFARREDLERLAAKDQRGDAVAAARSYDDQIAASRCRGIDNLDLDRLACDARCLGCGAKRYLGRNGKRANFECFPTRVSC